MKFTKHKSFGDLVTKPRPALVTPWTVALQAPLSMRFSRQEYWSGCHFLLQVIWINRWLVNDVRVYSGVACGTFTMLSNPLLYVVPRHVHCPPKKRPLPIQQVAPRPSLLPVAGNLCSAFCLYGLICSGYFIQMRSHNTWLCVSGFSIGTIFLRLLQHVSVLHSSSWPNNALLHGCTTLCSPIRLLMDV